MSVASLGSRRAGAARLRSPTTAGRRGDHRARGAALRPPARPLLLGAGAAPGLAVHLRRGLPLGARRVDPAALRNLRAVRGLHHAGPVRDDPLFAGMQSSLSMVYDREMGSMRVLLVSPLPRWYLLVAKLLAGTLVAVLQVYAFLAVAWFWEVEPPPSAISPCCRRCCWRAYARRARPAPVLGDPAARELRRRDELRHLPDVLRVLGALSALAGERIQRAALEICAANPFTQAVELIRFALSASSRRSRSWSRSAAHSFFSASRSSATTRRAASSRRGGRPEGRRRRSRHSAALRCRRAGLSDHDAPRARRSSCSRPRPRAAQHVAAGAGAAAPRLRRAQPRLPDPPAGLARAHPPGARAARHAGAGAGPQHHAARRRPFARRPRAARGAARSAAALAGAPPGDARQPAPWRERRRGAGPGRGAAFLRPGASRPRAGSAACGRRRRSARPSRSA